jgi:hypothetical protein
MLEDIMANYICVDEESKNIMNLWRDDSISLEVLENEYLPRVFELIKICRGVESVDIFEAFADVGRTIIDKYRREGRELPQKVRKEFFTLTL